MPPVSPPLTVVLTGVESTGKTTLARDLAHRFACPWAPEAARAFVLRKGAPLTADDVTPLAEEQIAGEDDARARADRLLILDTDLLSTVVYARHYFGSCPPWIERTAAERRGDLYLFHHPDVPWIADGFQRAQPEERDTLHKRFKEALEALGVRVVDVKGTFAERRETAERAVERLLDAEGHQTGD